MKGKIYFILEGKISIILNKKRKNNLKKRVFGLEKIFSLEGNEE
jgi:hypothetical protein